MSQIVTPKRSIPANKIVKNFIQPLLKKVPIPEPYVVSESISKGLSTSQKKKTIFRNASSKKKKAKSKVSFNSKTKPVKAKKVKRQPSISADLSKSINKAVRNFSKGSMSVVGTVLKGMRKVTVATGKATGNASLIVAKKAGKVGGHVVKKGVEASIKLGSTTVSSCVELAKEAVDKSMVSAGSAVKKGVTHGKEGLTTTVKNLANGTQGLIFKSGKLLSNNVEELLHNLKKTHSGLSWNSEQATVSPIAIRDKANALKSSILKDKNFIIATSNFTRDEKKLFAQAIAIENSPVSKYAHNTLAENKFIGDDIVQSSIASLADDNLKYVSDVTASVAEHVGFKTKVEVISKSDIASEIVYHGCNGKRLAVYVKLDKQLNPTMALDLEGYSTDTKECSEVMDKIVAYINLKGVPYDVKRRSHFNPNGVLRSVLRKKRKSSVTSNQDSMATYFQGDLSNSSKELQMS